MSTFVRVGSKKDFPEGRTTAVKANGVDISVAHAVGNFYAFNDECTHAAAMLSGSDIEEGNISCPLHGAQFSVSTGKALTLPAVEPLKMYDVKVDGDDVFVNVG